MIALLKRVEAFLAKSRMGPSYFGRRAVGNSELVERLRKGGEVKRRTERSVLQFIERECESRFGMTIDDILAEAEEAEEEPETEGAP
ncbi:hypothetical protein [Pseudophaeobacter sp. C1-32P7]|uniref:hypothetical protein n=1 Tax=Pseudophaeobacter sp. C1-32P7 TaxID=3098142 RepID=UPI0034D4D906